MAEKTYTEAEKRQFQHEAWMACYGWLSCMTTVRVSEAAVRAESDRRYPAPTKPRVVAFNGNKYRVVDGKIQYQHDSDKWATLGNRAEEVRVLADLLANPTEPED